jgi:hypothetical protein
MSSSQALEIGSRDALAKPPRVALKPVVDEQPPPEQASEAPRRPLLAAVPSWLVSLVVHLALVLILALLTIPQAVKSVGTFLEATPADEELVELIEPVKVEVVDLQQVDFASADVSSETLTSDSVADVGELSSAADLSVADVDVPAQAEIGDLFAGDGGRAMGSSVASDAKSAAQFFGVKATGRRFVFIVDSSNSMRGGKFAAAKEELMYSIRRLTKDQAFYIIFFDRDAERMLLLPDKEPPLLPVPATNDHINRVEKWTETVENELRTDPFEAVKFAIEMVPDAIYLLTDGKFTDRGQTERFLKNNNVTDDPVEGYRPKVVIHTICFWQKDGEETLQAIAKDYRGTYRFVPRPEGKKKKAK